MDSSKESSNNNKNSSNNNNHLAGPPALPSLTGLTTLTGLTALSQSIGASGSSSSRYSAEEEEDDDYVKKEENSFASCLYSSAIKHEDPLSIYGSVPSHVKLETEHHQLYSASAAAAAIGLLHSHNTSVYDPLPQRNWLSERTSQVTLLFIFILFFFS